MRAPDRCARRSSTANAAAGHDTIVFNIGGAFGVQVIAPATDLDTITDPVTIDGYTQLGALAATPNSNAVMMIVIDAGGLDYGLDVAAETASSGAWWCTTRPGAPGSRSPGTPTSSRATTSAPTDIGLQAAGNAGPGLEVHGDENRVGRPDPADRNVIAANAAAS